MLLDGLWQGLQHLGTLSSLLALGGGTVLGILFGAIPGLSSMTAVALLLPFAYAVGAETALIAMVGSYVGAMYGGSIPAILFRTPGTSAAIVTTFDGYPLAQQGRAGEALAVSAIAGGFGTFASGVLLLLLAPQLAGLALGFGPPEYLALGFLALSAITSLGEGNQIKAAISALLGLLVSMIGTDPLTGLERFTFGFESLITGVDPIPALIGLFAVSEVLQQAARFRTGGRQTAASVSSKVPSLRELWGLRWVFALGTAIGAWVGILPGEGGTIACVMSYNMARQWSKNPERYGSGSLEGVAAPEAANNAVVGAALIPTLALGIPGSATAALMLGAFTTEGIAPGPFLFTKYSGLVNAIILSVMIAALLVLVVGLTAVRFFGKVMLVPYPILASCIVLFSVVGSYVMRNNMFDVWVMLVFGLLGYIMSKSGFPLAAMTLGLILGPILESSFGRSMLLFGGDYLRIFTRPMSGTLMALSIAFLVLPWLKPLIQRQSPKARPA